MQLEAARHLAKLDRQTAIEPLQKLAQNAENEDLRISAIRDLIRISPQAAITALQWLAENAKNDRIKLWATEALGELGAPPLGCEEL